MKRFYPFLLLLALATPAAAEVYCVATAAQFVNAVFAARASTTASEIKMVAGTYSLPSAGGADQATLTIGDGSGLIITGGYAAGCPGGVPNSSPDQTVIRPLEFDQRLIDIVPIVGEDNQVTIQQVSFRRGRSLTVRSACMFVDGRTGASGRVNLINTEFTDCSGPGPGCALNVSMDSMSFNLNNSLIHTNSCSGGAVVLVPGPNSIMSITNNTIARNVHNGAPGPGGLQIGHQSGPTTTLYLTNNVIYHNGAVDDVDVQFNTNVPGFARSNFIGRQSPFPSAMLLSNNSSADPQFLSTTNFRPAATSPVINAGHGSALYGLPPKDLDGTARPQGGTYDAGAYERIQEGFRNGFE